MTEIIIALNEIQREAFLDFLSDYPRVIRTLQDRFPCDEICHSAMVLADTMEEFSVPEVLTDLDRAILKASVERSAWLEPYEGQSNASKDRKGLQLKALRECARRLETLGIEVDHLPS